ncbi:Protein BATH-38 [Aphelenchoides avenae]|nr:Protein BATH-38 [Aphelenchus avenae]
MSDNPPPNPPQNENASTSGDGPRAKKAKTSHTKESDSIARLDTARGGSRKATITLDIYDVEKFKTDNVKVEGDKVTLSGIDWWITAEIIDGYLSVRLRGSHPSMAEWHCKANMNVRKPAAKRSNDDGILLFTHKKTSWGYNKFMPIEKLTADYDDLTVSFELTTYNCYVTDGAFGCRSRFHDVTFDFGQRYLYGNKGFLAANADYFEAMFFGDFADKSKDVVTLKKVKTDDFAEFLKALAPSPMPLNDKTVIAVLRMADRFQAHGLVERCTNFLLRDKCIQFVNKLQVADDLLMSHLRDQLIDNASLSDIRKASKLENESKFSKLTWIKLFHEYMRLRDDSSDSESDSDA